MADTINDVTMTSNVWLDVYNLTGIAPGSSLIVNNKSAATVFIQVKASQPAAASNDGWPLRAAPSESTWTVIEDVPAASRVWVKGQNTGKLFVQLYD